jgi:hypothetical protein
MIHCKILGVAERRNPGAVASIVLGLALVLGLTRAHAQPTSAADRSFSQGQALLKDGHISQACEQFAESQRLEAALGTLINLASCHERQNKLATAVHEYQAAAAWARERGSSELEREQFARERVRVLETQVPTLRVQLNGPLEDVTVEIDGNALPRANASINVQLDPGTHVVTAKASGKRTWQASLELAAGESRTLEPTFEDEPLAPPTPTGARASDRSWAYVLGASGIAVATVGAALLIHARVLSDSSQREAQRAVMDEGAIDTTHQRVSLERYDSAVRSQTLGVIALSAGAIAVGFAVPILLLRSRHEPSQLRVARVVPEFGPGSFGVVVRQDY